MSAPIGRTAPRLLLPLGLLLAVSGCYSYAPVELAVLRPGTDVRARLTPDGIGHIAGRLARPMRELDGIVVSMRADTLVLAAWQADRQSRIAFRPVTDTLMLARSHIAALQTRRFSTVRTGLLVGGLATGLYLIARSVLDGGEQQGRTNGPDTTPFLVVPLPLGGPR